MLTLLRQGQAAIRRRLGRTAQTFMLLLTLMFAGAAVMAPAHAMAQNLGTTPAVGQAVQGQTAAQPEGTLLNLVNWVGNVICPVGAALFVVAAVVQYRGGRGWAPSAITAVCLLMVSAITRLAEYFIQNGQQVG